MDAGVIQTLGPCLPEYSIACVPTELLLPPLNLSFSYLPREDDLRFFHSDLDMFHSSRSILRQTFTQLARLFEAYRTSPASHRFDSSVGVGIKECKSFLPS